MMLLVDNCLDNFIYDKSSIFSANTIDIYLSREILREGDTNVHSLSDVSVPFTGFIRKLGLLLCYPPR